MYSLHFLSVESFYFWSLYGVIEQQRLISDFADDRDAPFLLEAARMYYCVPVRRSGTEKTYQTVLTQIRLRTQKRYDKGLTVKLRLC